MAINYSLVKLASKFGDKAGVPLFYARAQMKDSISLKKFAKLISMQTTVSYADVTAVLVSMQENMIIELQRGNQIDFGELGKFRLQLTSEGAATAAEFKSDINIKVDASYRNSETIVRYLDYDNNQLSGGQNLWSAKLTADYSFSKNLTAIFYYDHSFSKAVISTSFPITNIRAGFTLRYNFGN